MTEPQSSKRSAQSGRRGRAARAASPAARRPNYRQLRHPYTPQRVFSDDYIAQMHDSALRVLEELGLRVLLPEARQIFAAAGALVDEDEQMVRIGRDLVEAALHTAPRSMRMRARNPAREQRYESGRLLFAAASGCPNVTDLLRGRRPGSLRDFEEVTKLQQSFDVIHKHGPSAEPQDVPPPLRHYAMTRVQLHYGDKPLFVFSRGRQQVRECFEMIQLALGLSDEAFTDGFWANTVINSNSPRQLDMPMAEAIIDFARAGQMTVITPFCLSGAMAPVTVAGALVLQHAEALAGITLAQLSRAGAPVSYGGFASNVDMKSGAPAFGTPEHIKLSIGSGQLARHIGMPFRGAAGSAGNAADMQSAGENHMGLWAQMQANTTMVLHAAGWLEGGLAFGYEKFINDVEALQILAELCMPPVEDDASLAFEAIADVEPGGHFFSTAHTIERFDQAFYAPLVADLRNHGSWLEAGGQSASERATGIWQRVLADFQVPPGGEEAAARIADYIAVGERRGGAPPLS